MKTYLNFVILSIVIGYTPLALGDADPNCYTVRTVEKNGVSAREFVNSANGEVFMTAANSRIRISPKSMLSTAAYSEYQNAKASRQDHVISRHHHTLMTETPSIKVRVETVPGAHRFVGITKSNIPQCVGGNPESLL